MRGRRLGALALVLGLGMPADAAEPAAPGRALLNPLAALDPAKLDGFLGRPLFSPSRRPPPPPPEPPQPEAEPPPPPEAPPAIRLVGIVRTARESIAQLVGEGGPQRLSVRVGDLVGSWTVASIEASGIVLKLGEREARFDIFTGHAADPPPAAAEPEL